MADHKEEIGQLIDFAANAEYNKASAVFNTVVGEKLSDALDQEKVRISGQVYNSISQDDVEMASEAKDYDDEDEDDDEDDDEDEDNKKKKKKSSDDDDDDDDEE